MAATSLALQRQPSTASSRFSSRNYPPEVGPTMSKEEAALISSRIDDEIKKEASRLKDAKKREVKVMLLGQAESGKSTLQKQFQLFYASKTLDAERQSWIPVVYSNIIKALRMIFAELDHELTLRTANEPLSSPEVTQELNGLRVRLLPLLAQEDVLATELSGGVSIAGGRTGAYVRQGWQSIITGSKSSETKRAELANRTRETTRLVGRTLALAVDDIDALWTHEAVKFYIQQRKIRLDDSASYFLKHIQRIGDADYVPSNGGVLYFRHYDQYEKLKSRPEFLFQMISYTFVFKLWVCKNTVFPYPWLARRMTGNSRSTNKLPSLTIKHFTSMLDIKATQSIISNVAEAIMRKHIAEVGLA
ncbi:hypothetical protein D9613_000087 [Agrocybe pediades]|uniref:Uncharacterized protein n=1 Tax=Agrocybe pediades TaxID=84607 RepID=A0A8H4QZL8_9AGAR|nr:hypothetical protein D9613_000087 [Agrocybe pediades]